MEQKFERYIIIGLIIISVLLGIAYAFYERDIPIKNTPYQNNSLDINTGELTGIPKENYKKVFLLQCKNSTLKINGTSAYCEYNSSLYDENLVCNEVIIKSGTLCTTFNFTKGVFAQRAFEGGHIGCCVSKFDLRANCVCSVEALRNYFLEGELK